MDPAPNAATLPYSEVFDPAVIRITVPAVDAEPDRDRGGSHRPPISNRPGEKSSGMAIRP